MNKELQLEIETLKRKNFILQQAVNQSQVIKKKFNESTRLLKMKDTELEELNNSLEKKVIQRTKELQNVLWHEECLRNVLQITTEINEMLITSFSTKNIIKECGEKLSGNADYSSVIAGLINNNILEVIFKSQHNNYLFNESIIGLNNSDYIIKQIQKSSLLKSTIVKELSEDQAKLYGKWLISLPLININTDDVYGVVIIFCSRNSGFNKEEIKILQNMAHDMNNAIHTHKQQGEILKMEKEKTSNYEETILAFVNIIEQRDTYTAGHTIRVANYCSLIAHEMDFSREDIVTLEKAAILHDIGKVATPDTILLKPGKLSGLEYELIKQHCNTGYNMLKKISIYHDLAEIIKYHHAHYDGSGYPETSHPDEIPMLSHVMIVADAFDAMTTNRIYRTKLSIGDAIQEITNGSGKQFHPKVIKAAIIVLQNIKLETTSQMPSSDLEQKRMAYFFRDSLTGLYNEDYLQILFNIHKGKFACLNVIHIRKFTAYNQKHGWENGNNFLKKIAILLEKLYPQSTIVRYHGDDFILLNETHIEVDTKALSNYKIIINSNINIESTHYDIQSNFSFKEFKLFENT